MNCCAIRAAWPSRGSRILGTQTGYYGLTLWSPTLIVQFLQVQPQQAAFRQGVLSKIKLGRLGQVEDLMGAILFLASDASALMTGSSLIIDGGWTAD